MHARTHTYRMKTSQNLQIDFYESLISHIRQLHCKCNIYIEAEVNNIYTLFTFIRQIVSLVENGSSVLEIIATSHAV